MNLTFDSVIKTFQDSVMKDLIELPDFTEQMIEYLSTHTVVVEFRKSDGETRVMRCTRDLNLIPESMHPKSNYSKLRVNSIPAFDLDRMEWRSFVPERIIKLSFDTPSHNSIH